MSLYHRNVGECHTEWHAGYRDYYTDYSFLLLLNVELLHAARAVSHVPYVWLLFTHLGVDYDLHVHCILLLQPLDSR